MLTRPVCQDSNVAADLNPTNIHKFLWEERLREEVIRRLNLVRAARMYHYTNSRVKVLGQT